MRFVLRWTLKFACIYLLAVVAIMVLEERLMFGAGVIAGDRLPDTPVEEVWLTTSDGVKLHSLFFPCPANENVPTAERRAVLFFHGNGGNAVLWSWCGPEWHAFLEADVLVMDYRGFGKSGGVACETGCYRDARAAYDWLTGERGYVPDKVILIGRSLGSGVAIELATQVPHGGVIVGDAYATAVDVAAEVYPWLPVRWIMRNRFDSLSRVGRINGPIFAFHGANDRLMPLHHPERLIAAATGRKELFLIPGGTHGTIVNDEFGPAVRSFFGIAESSSNELSSR